MNHMRLNRDCIAYMTNPSKSHFLVLSDSTSKLFRVGLKRRLKRGEINMSDTVSITISNERIRTFSSNLTEIDAEAFMTVEADVKSILDILYRDNCMGCPIIDTCGTTPHMPCDLLAAEALLLNKEMSIN